MYNTLMRKYIFFFIFLSTIVNAANWLMIQGTEKKQGHHPWGFLQIKQEHNYGKTKKVSGKNKTPFSYIRPTLQEQSELLLNRLRIGIRGGFDEENNINYFVLTEIAQNGVNNPLGYATPTYIVDASLTFKYLPIYIRVGKFKYAGSEEGNMARFTSPFINFSTVGNQLMLERFVGDAGVPTQGVGAYRDTGVQLFQSYEISAGKSISLSYMLGNGSGTANKNVNDNKFTNYGYISFEDVLGKGKGYKLESYKLYAWAQSGKRLYQDDFYDRTRYGAGATYFNKGLRVEAEYMAGMGMIVNGVKDNNSVQDQEDWAYKMADSKDNKANGFYILSTYSLFEPLELLVKYDVYNRMTNDDASYRKFESLTTGFSYIFEKYNRIDVNYAFNSIDAPYNASAQKLLSSTVGDLFSVQLTWVIK